MDMLGENPSIRLDDEHWRIYSRHENESPQYVGADARIENSSITESCEIYGTVINSVLGCNVKVMPGALVRNSVIMSGVTIEENATVCYSIIDSNVVVGKNAKVGKPKDDSVGISVIGQGVVVPDGYVIGDNEMITEI